MEFEENFKIPPPINSPFPFWFLNDDLDEQTITWALDEFKNKHISSVVLHPRTGLQINYLSDEFWKKMDFIIKKCDAMGIKVILYDEYNWPSGPMGGKLFREHPEFKQTFLNYKIISKEKRVALDIEGEYLTAFEVNQKTGEVKELTEKLQDKGFQWESPGKDWELIIFSICLLEDKLFATCCAPFSNGERGYIDLINPEAVKYFIENTHEEYKKRFSQYFGNTIIAIFTDEPGNYAGWMWTTEFLQKFQTKVGFDLKPKLYQLVYEIGPDYLKTRHHYYTFISELYTTSFFKQIGDWCKNNNLKFTGHLVMEEELMHFPRVHSTLFAPLREMQIPGIDYLSDKSGYELESSMFLSAPNFTAKMISSITHHLGLNRNLCEIFGGSGWQTTPERLKKVIAWITCCGVNWINHHAAHLSLKGLRKRDFPPSFFVQEPWWKYFASLSDFTSRLCYFNTLGNHIAHFAILFPQTALNLNYTIYKKTKNFYQIVKEFPKIGDILLRIQCDFDYLFEELFLEDKIALKNGQILSKNETYNVIVIPPINIIPLKIYQFLLNFYSNGGSIIFAGHIPTNSETKANDAEIQRINAIFFGETLPIKSEAVNQNPQNGKVLFVPLKYIHNRKLGEKYFEELLHKTNIQRDILLSRNKRDFIYQHRRIGEDDYYLIANLSNQDVLQDINFFKKGFVTAFYPETGDIYRLENALSEETRLSPFLFKPYQSIILLITSVNRDHYPLLAKNLVRSDLPTLKIKPNWEINPVEENLFLLNDWSCKILQRTPPTADQIQREQRIWSKVSFRIKFLAGFLKPFIWLLSPKKVQNSIYSAFEMLDSSAGLLQTIFGINVNEDFAGFYELMDIISVVTKKISFKIRDFEPGDVIQISKTFTVKFLPPDDMRLVYEDLGLPISIILNHKKIENGELKHLSKQCFVWDAANREFPVKDYLKLGKNKIQITLTLPDFPDLLPSFHGIEPFVIRGGFSTTNNSIIAPIQHNRQISWTKTGLTTYSGPVIYKNSFSIPKEYLSHTLILKFSSVRDTVELKINRTSIGEAIWAPYEFDITKYIKEGSNSIEAEIRNTAANFFAKPRHSGLLDNVVIVPYKEPHFNFNLKSKKSATKLVSEGRER